MALLWTGVVGLLLLALPAPSAQAQNECGDTSVFAARYSSYNEASGLGATFSAGDIVSTDESGTIELWRYIQGSDSSQEPSTADPAGWERVTDQYALMKVDCDSADIIGASTAIQYSEDALAVIFNRPGTTVGAISMETSSTGEIHVVAGGVSYPDGGSVAFGNAVSLVSTGSDTIRVVTNAGTGVHNLDTTSGNRAIYMASSGNIHMDISGSTSVVARGDTGNGNTAIYAHSQGGNIDMRINGGLHQAGGGGSDGSVVYANLQIAGNTDQSAGDGTIDIQINGANTILTSPGADAAVVHAYARAGDVSIGVGIGSTICAGNYSSSTRICGVLSTARAISANRQFANTGSFDLTNAGLIVGAIQNLGSASSRITNNGVINGSFSSTGNNADTVVNHGTFRMIADSDFGGGTDSFTTSGSGTFVVYYLNSLINLNNLETFTLQAPGAGQTGGILQFSVATNNLPSVPLVDFGDATLSLAGTVNYVTRDGSSLPAFGATPLMNVDSTFSSRGLSPASTLGSDARLFVALDMLFLSFGDICGAPMERTVQAPGRANRQILCDTADTNLTAASDVINFERRVAVVYNRKDPIRSIANDGLVGEIHILSGSVLRPNDRSANAYNAVHLGPDTYAASRIVTALQATSPEGRDTADDTSDDLTSAQVFARDRAVRVYTARGTSVANQDPHGAISGVSSGNTIQANGWGGHVYMDLYGDTYGAYAGIRATTLAAGDVYINIDGGTHRALLRTPLYVWARPITGARPSGKVDIDIRGGARLSSEAEALTGSPSDSAQADVAAVRVDAEWSYSTTTDPIQAADLLHTIDIEKDSVLCRGVFNTLGACQPFSGVAIALTATGTRPQADGPEPVFHITNQGQIYGDILTFRNARGVRVTNRGGILGNYKSASAGSFGAGTNDGPDILRNEEDAVWIMTGASDFGEGADSFHNQGTLVLRYSGTQISIASLDTFVQVTSAKLRVEIDPRRFTPDGPDEDGLPDLADPDLPSGPILNFGNTAGTVGGGLEVVLLDTVGLRGALSRSAINALIAGLDETVFALIVAGHSLDFTETQLLTRGLTRDSDGTLFYDLAALPIDVPVTIFTRETDAFVAHTYDSVIQAGWSAVHAFLNELATSECNVQTAFSEESSATAGFKNRNCGWMSLGGRLTIHDRETPRVEETQEIAYAISGGIQAPLGNSGWGVNTTLTYEFSDMDIGKGEAQGHRILLGALASTVADEDPWNWLIGLTAQGALYEVKRPDFSVTNTSEPLVVMAGAHAGVEYVFSRQAKIGQWAFIPRIQVDAVGVWVDGFKEKGIDIKVAEILDVFVSVTPSLEGRHSAQASWGEMQSWIEVGVVGFATDPHIDYKISREGGAKEVFAGTLERFLLEASVGINFARRGGVEFSLFWDGLLGMGIFTGEQEETFTNALTLKVKYAF